MREVVGEIETTDTALPGFGFLAGASAAAGAIKSEVRRTATTEASEAALT